MFTLIELLVVIAIIALLVAILLPSLAFTLIELLVVIAIIACLSFGRVAADQQSSPRVSATMKKANEIGRKLWSRGILMSDVPARHAAYRHWRIALIGGTNRRNT